MKASEWKEETDSVEARFGGEYSEATLDLLRQHQKPEWMEEDSSLDPVEDMDDYARLNLRIPPSTYDAAMAAVEREVEELERSKDLRLPADEERLIKYRKQLVEGTSLNDLNWIKLRAYHRVMDKQRAEAAAAAMPQAKRQLMEQHQVPLDVVPQELIDMSLEQLADRWYQGQTSSSSQAAAASSDESDWPADWASTSYLQDESARAKLWGAFAPKQGLGSLLPRVPTNTTAPEDRFGAIVDSEELPPQQAWRPVHEFTREHLDEVALQRKIQMQQRQRVMAFWLPLATVLGVYAVKGVRRLLRPKKDSKGAKPSRVVA